MTTRTFHPLPKRPSFAVPAAGAGSQRHSQQQQQHGHTASTSTHTQPSTATARGQSATAAASSPTSVTTPVAQSTTLVQLPPLKPIALPPALTESTSLLGSRIELDASFHISCATYSGTVLACERFREYIRSTWKRGSDVLEQYIFDFGQVEGQISLYRYEDILCDTEEFSSFGMSLRELVIWNKTTELR
jgi:hypothetical protein